MVYRAGEVARNAERDDTNAAGMCLQWCREKAGIDPLYRTAAAAWTNTNTRFPGDRHPPRGAPVYWTGGSKGYGHVAISLGGGRVRSTDAGGKGVVATRTLAWFDTNWPGMQYAGWAKDINEVTIPGVPNPGAHRLIRLHLMHASMQATDSTAQKTADATALFERAAKREVAWLTGTEAFERNAREALHDQAAAHGYRFWAAAPQDCWIAVRRTMITGGWETHWQKVIDGVARRHTAQGVMAVEFDSLPEIGHVTVMAAHLLTKGRPGAVDPDYRVNLPKNRAITKANAAFARKQGAGKALVFYGGDQNIPDRSHDTFLGQPLTSAWDELKKYENTGHGVIDVIASYNADTRVKASYCRALDDTEFPLQSDHFLVEAGYDVAAL